MSERILMIETSTECCSVALCDGESVISKKRSVRPRIHAAMTAPFVKETLEDASLKMSDVDAVAISAGPGSYTGLRVGVSTAKGLCFGAGKPLVAVDTLEILATYGKGHTCHPLYIVPFIDAGRMEVYTATFDSTGRKLTDTEALILDGDSFSDLMAQGPVLFIGTGTSKFKEICSNCNAFFEECFPLAENMTHAAVSAFKKKEFKDVAYFEPFYLKEFIPGISRKSILSH